MTTDGDYWVIRDTGQMGQLTRRRSHRPFLGVGHVRGLRKTRARTTGLPDRFTSQESTHDRPRYQSGRKTQHQGEQEP